ncbi:MAG: arginine--tRNA ligase [Thermoplasmata archaeon]
MHPLELMENKVKEKMLPILKKYGMEDKIRIYKAPKNFGDLTIDLQKADVDIDKQEIEALSDDEMSFKKVNKFINVKYNDNKLSFMILESALDGTLFNFSRKNMKVLIEHTSANPTGPLHVGRVRNSIIGDTVYRIFKKFGYDVRSEYYVNDIGTQVEALILGTELYGEENYTESYRRYYEEIDSHKNEIERNMKMAESGDREFILKSRKKLERFLNDVLIDLKNLNISFDSFAWESDFIINGDVKNVVQMLSPYMMDEGGAKYIPVGDGKIFLIRSNSTSLYFTRDVAYHIQKSKNYDISVDVLGEDHKEHFRNLMYVLNLISIKNIEPIFYSYVVTKEGKMSTRRGNVIYVRDMIQESVERAKAEIIKRRQDISDEEINDISFKIGTASVRFNIIKYSPEKPITFDWEEALNFEGEAAPFVMYSYARAVSILNKAGEIEAPLNKNIDQREAELLREIGRFPEVIRDAAEHKRPDRVAKYSFELASSFNQFYRDCPVLDDKINIGKRVSIIKAFISTMRETLDLLGIKTSDKI